MSKYLILLLLLIPINVLASPRNMVVMDSDTNRVLYEKNAHDEHLIASITKIATAIVAIENANLNDLVEVNESILKSFGSSIYLEVGEKITLKDLLYGLMMRSGNDAAVTIASYVCPTIEEFVKLMNKLVTQLNLQNTTFVNPSGLEEDDGSGNISSAYDMGIIMNYAMQNDIFKTIVKTNTYKTTSSIKTYSWTNKNKLLRTYKYTTGGKTGYTKKAGRTLVTTASKDNKNITIVTFDDGNDFNTHKNMYEQVFKLYSNVLILDKDKFRVEDDTYYDNNLYILDDVYLLLKDKEEKNIKLDINLEKKTNYENKEIVGYVNILLNDDILKTVNIYVKKEEEEKLSLIEKIIRWFKND